MSADLFWKVEKGRYRKVRKEMRRLFEEGGHGEGEGLQVCVQEGSHIYCVSFRLCYVMELVDICSNLAMDEVKLDSTFCRSSNFRNRAAPPGRER